MPLSHPNHMVTVAAAPLSALPCLTRPHLQSSYRWPPSFCRRSRRPPALRLYAVEPNSSPHGPREYQEQSQQLPPTPPPRTLFPGGFKRPEIKVPTLALQLSVEEVLDAEGSAADIDFALSSGVGMVVLDFGTGSGGARLYEAACALKSLVGDRAYLLITERVDVAAAVGASGVVLSDDAIPAIIARNMMMSAKSNSIYLPLVARKVQNINSAINASSSEGADFLLMSANTGNLENVVNYSVSKHIKVPIFFSVIDFLGDLLPVTLVSELLESGACGIVMSITDLKRLGENHVNDLFKAYEANNAMQDENYSFTKGKMVGANAINDKKRVTGFTKLDEREIQLIEAEKLLINEAVAAIQKASPMMKEVSLLTDAASRLTEPFLLVIVGEFNSGKSTVINALLGRKYLKEGVVPTTNEITLLRYSEIDSGNYNRCERVPDGQFICYLSAPILKEMNLVDTPGTNVILQRQQRLTEEYVPRADLILFVISADRPLTESEVGFLLYVQQWRKRVVFVLNKLDLYRSNSELEEAIAFVRSNASKLLNIEDMKLFPVSARSALDAKLSSVSDGSKSEELLFTDPRWLSSRFFELEEFLYSFLDGSTETGMERVKLKLQSPLGIADRLLFSCQRLVKQDYENVNQDLESIKQVRRSISDYAAKIESESISWRKQALSLLETAKSRTMKLMESILQLSNTNLISTYAFRGEKSTSLVAASAVQNEILNPALSDVQRLIGEYSLWLDSKSAQAAKLYVEQFDRNWQALVGTQNAVRLDIYKILDKDENLSFKVLQKFSTTAASRLFEQEIREVVLGTFGGLGAAGLSASLLTSVLPTTLEDLLALAICSTGGLLAISNFPARRKEAMAKIERTADSLIDEFEDAMRKDLLHSVEKLNELVEVLSKPYTEAGQSNIDQLRQIQVELASVEQSVQAMKVKIQNLHLR